MLDTGDDHLAGRVKYEVLHSIKKERNILHIIQRRKANWIAQIVRRNCLLKHVIEGKMERMGRRGRRRKQPLNDFKEKIRSWKFPDEALYSTLWRTRHGRSCGPVVKQSTL